MFIFDNRVGASRFSDVRVSGVLVRVGRRGTTGMGNFPLFIETLSSTDCLDLNRCFLDPGTGFKSGLEVISSTIRGVWMMCGLDSTVGIGAEIGVGAIKGFLVVTVVLMLVLSSLLLLMILLRPLFPAKLRETSLYIPFFTSSLC